MFVLRCDFLFAYLFFGFFVFFLQYLTGRGSYCLKVYCHVRLYQSWSFGLREQAFVCLDLLAFSELLSYPVLSMTHTRQKENPGNSPLCHPSHPQVLTSQLLLSAESSYVCFIQNIQGLNCIQ